MKTFPPETIERLGWVLIHSLWQFAVLAIVAGVIVATLRQRSAATRYAVLAVAMALMVVAPCVTWMMFPQPAAFETPKFKPQHDSSYESGSLPPLENLAGHGTTMSPNAEIEPPMFPEPEQTRSADVQPLAGESLVASMTEYLRSWFSWIVSGWMIGVLLCSLRPLLGWRMLRRLRRIGISPPPKEVLAAFSRVSLQLGLRQAVQVFHSTLANGPMVIGYLKPVVLLPVSLATSIPMPQLEAILAHELAHIRRHDFVINLAQTMMETFFFYHPAIWWLSRRIRIEREHCCDDLVVKLFKNRIDYGRALLAIEQLQSQRTVLALGATDSSLLGRIRRITGSQPHEPPCFPFAATTIAGSLVFGTWLAGQSFLYSANDETNKPETDSAAVSEEETPDNDAAPEVLTVQQNQWRLVNWGFRIREIEVFSPDIVSVESRQDFPNSFEVIGKSTGSTTVKLADERGEEFLIPVQVINDDRVNPPFGDREFRLTTAHLLPKHLSEDKSRLTLIVGGSIELEFPWLVSQTRESEKGIVEVTIAEYKNPVIVRGLSAGKTSLRITNAVQDERIIVIEVLPMTRASIRAIHNLNVLQADIPTGGIIEFPGVTMTGNDSSQGIERKWWKPNGTILSTSPIDQSEIQLNENQRDGRLFLFRIPGRAMRFPQDFKVQFLKNGQPRELQQEQKPWVESTFKWNPQTRFCVVEFAAGPAGDADSATIDLRFSSQPDARISFDRQGQILPGFYGPDYASPFLNASVNLLFRRVHVLRVGPHNDGFAIWTKPFDSSSEDGQVTLNVHTSDRYVQTSNWQSDGSEQRYFLDTKPADVQSIAMEFHTWNSQISIRNVALNPGNRTHPRVIAKRIASEQIGELEARETLTEVYGDLIEFDPAAEGLQDLRIRDLPTPAWQFISLLRNIRSIEIQGGDLRHSNLQYIARIPGLKSLKIAGAKCLPENLGHLRDHPTLENLNVELSTQEELANENERLHIWTHTTFNEREWIDTNLKRLSQRFPDEVVNRHRLEAAVLTDRGIGSLFSLKNLKSLRLTNSPVSGDALAAFALLPNLQQLNIEVIAPSDETGATLASFPALQSLGTIEGIPDVFPPLSFSKTLEELTVSWLTDAAVVDLLQMSQLRRLHLHSSELSDAGLLKLAKLSQLTDLSLIESKGTITDQGIARLREFLPNCRVMMAKAPIAISTRPGDQKPAVAGELPDASEVEENP